MQLNTAVLRETTLPRWVLQEASEKKVAFVVKVTVIFRDPELSHLKVMLSRYWEPATQQSSLTYQTKEIVKYTSE